MGGTGLSRPAVLSSCYLEQGVENKASRAFGPSRCIPSPVFWTHSKESVKETQNEDKSNGHEGTEPKDQRKSPSCWTCATYVRGLREAQTSPCGNTETPNWSIHRAQNTGEYSTLDWIFIPCLKAQRSSWKMGWNDPKN